MRKETGTGSFRDMEREMLENIDVEAIERAHRIANECDHVVSITKIDKPVEKIKVTSILKTAAESTRCKWSGKVQFDTTSEAMGALKRWQMKDRNVCWDLRRMRIYKCKKCYKLHMGKE